MADWPSGLPVECGFPVDRNAGVAGNGVVHGIISLILVLPGSPCSSEKITKMGGTVVLASVRTTHVDELRTVGSFVKLHHLLICARLIATIPLQLSLLKLQLFLVHLGSSKTLPCCAQL